MFSCLSLALNIQEHSKAESSLEDKDKNIRIVFLGITGSGKSTLINAFYNFSQGKKWNDPVKHFPVPTEFQECNVDIYKNNKIEDLQGGQLNSVTQAPSEYISQARCYTLSMIDCPGAADQRGIEQDRTNNLMIAETLSGLKDINAICIVFPATINRANTELCYAVDQIKSVIPKNAIDRIFICLSYGDGEYKNALEIVQYLGLPIDNVFSFDNFALTKDGYLEELYDDSLEKDFNNIFGEVSARPKARNDRLILKIRNAWLNSQNEYFKIIKKAHELGKYEAKQWLVIFRLEKSIKQKIDVLNIEELLLSKTVNEKDDLLFPLVDLIFKNLNAVSMSSVNKYLHAYCDVCIRQEHDLGKKKKLQLEKDFQAELFAARARKINKLLCNLL